MRTAHCFYKDAGKYLLSFVPGNRRPGHIPVMVYTYVFKTHIEVCRPHLPALRTKGPLHSQTTPIAPTQGESPTPSNCLTSFLKAFVSPSPLCCICSSEKYSQCFITCISTITPTPQVLVKKSYGDKVKRSKQRNWQLQMIDREMDVTVATTNEKGAEEDYEEFLEDLEEDTIYRKNVNIFFSEFQVGFVKQGRYGK